MHYLLKIIITISLNAICLFDSVQFDENVTKRQTVINNEASKKT